MFITPQVQEIYSGGELKMVNLTAYIAKTTIFQQYLEALIARPPTVRPGLGLAWLDEDTWKAIGNSFLQTLTRLGGSPNMTAIQNQ